MKIKLLFLSILLLMISCSDDEDSTPKYDVHFRQEMRDFIIGIS